MEALRIKEVDQMIESLQKEINRPEIMQKQETPVKKAIQEPTSPVERVQEKSKDINKEVPKTNEQINLHVQESELKQETSHVQEDTVQNIDVPQETEALTQGIDEYKEYFTQLIEKIKDRNYELGKCFSNSVYYISYENNVLTWESCANKECKKILKHGYSAIKQLVREVYGFETKIKGITCSKEIKEDTLNNPHVDNKETNNTIQASQQDNTTQTQMVHTQTDSMIEEAEIGNASCISNCSEENAPKIINGADIENEPIVTKAIELFEVTKKTIQSKV
jgi:DNA polymerase-3 subunit gamma/tau